MSRDHGIAASRRFVSRALLPVVIVGCACACAPDTSNLPPHGEVLVIVDTDLPAPELASRLRVDLYGEDGRWFESRAIGRPDTRDWPASFSVFSDDEQRERRVLVRLRVHLEGSERAYLGERFETKSDANAKPKNVVASSLQELCTNAPELPLGGRLTLRSGAAKLTEVITSDQCPIPAAAGSVAASVIIKASGRYRFSVTSTTPYETYTTLTLRSRCEDVASQLACNKAPWGANVFTSAHFPTFDMTLDPGKYFMVTANAVHAWPSDITLEASSSATDTTMPDPDSGDGGGIVPNPIPSGPTTALPRLENGSAVDETPLFEPLPSTTVDRILLVRLVPGARGRVRITMRGVCAGTMAKLGADPTRANPDTAESCIDTEDVRTRVTETPIESGNMSRDDVASVQGTFNPGQPCDTSTTTTTTKDTSDTSTVCVPGGTFLFGSRLLSETTSTEHAPLPERIAIVERFWMDRHEFTVRRLREAIAHGFVVDYQDLFSNDRLFPTPESAGADVPREAFCTWSHEPLNREDFAVTCINWQLARELCRKDGGDLPTEAQWEYAASVAGRPHKTLFPWGDELPTCKRAVYGRGYGFGNNQCYVQDARLLGPAPITRAERTDLTPLGIVGLGGGVSELTLDAAASFASDCWQRAPLTNPSCIDDEAPKRGVRGFAWATSALGVYERDFVGAASPAYGIPDTTTAIPTLGFRCAYPKRPR